MHATVQERLGRDARKMYTIVGAPRSWMQDDIENCLGILRWTGEVKYAAKGQWHIRAASDPGIWTAVVGVGYERCTLRVEDLTLAKENRLKAKEAAKEPPPSRNETWKTLLKALPLPADADPGDSTEQMSTEAPWSAWDASAVQHEDSYSQGSLDDDWCEEDEAMADDWQESEQVDRFETRKRRANEQRQAEPTQVVDLKQENAQLRKQLEILTSTLAELKEEIVRMRKERQEDKGMEHGKGGVPDQVAPMDDGEAVVEIFEGRQEAVTYMAASVFHARKKQAAQEGKSFQLARLHHGSTMQA
eukprot:1805678-Amphidinium_carterae.1